MGEDPDEVFNPVTDILAVEEPTAVAGVEVRYGDAPRQGGGLRVIRVY